MIYTASRYILIPLCLVSFLLLGTNVLLAQADLSEGETIFKQRCSACHKVQGALIGPQLEGISAKYANDKEWLYSWVKNSPAMIQSGDEKAVALWEQYNKQAMSPHPDLTDQQIDNIFAWVDAEVIAITSGGDDDGKVSQEPVLDPSIYYAVLGLVGLLVLISILLVFITAVLVTAVQSKEQEEEVTLADIWARTKLILGNKYVITIIATIAIMGGSVKLVTDARAIGLHKGYMPEQPVKFSHKLHAGTNQIDCEYCHSGVTKSKNAWIPSVNVCMNCHKYIEEGPNYGKDEIAKVKAAYENNEAIEWVRIHNLPDHAYFNHAQHVVVGGLECQTCHGPVEEMEVVYQYTTLGMGWCVECHRETKVKNLGKETDFTVEDMGGLDCMRCHY